MKKKKMATGRCFEHPKDADRDRSRSPVVRPAVPTTAVPTAAIVRLRAGVEMMQNAVNEIADAAGGL